MSSWDRKGKLLAKNSSWVREVIHCSEDLLLSGKQIYNTHAHTHKHIHRSAILTHQCTSFKTSWWPGSLDLSGLLAKHAILKHLPWHFRQSVESGKQERRNQRRMTKGHVGIFMTWAPRCGGRAIVMCISSIKTINQTLKQVLKHYTVGHACSSGMF